MTPAVRFSRTFVSLVGLAVVVGCGPRPDQDAPIVPSDAAPPAVDGPAAPEPAEPLLEAFLVEYFEHRPVEATMLGDHAHDDAWPDLSAAGIGAVTAWATDMDARLSAARGALEEGAEVGLAVDLDIARDELGRLRFSLAEERIWQRNVLAYASLIGAGLDPLVVRDFAPASTRAVALAARLEGLPGLVDAAKGNLADPNALHAPHAAVGVAQLRALDGLFAGEVKALFEGLDDASLRDRGLAALPAARAAVADLADHVEGLEQRRLRSADETWRLGPELFARKLALTLGTDMDAREIHDEAVKAHAEVRSEMASIADELYPLLFSATPPEDLDARTRAVLEALARIHVQPEALRDAAEENLERLETFVREHEIVPMDPDEVLEVVWTPPHQRGVAIAGLDAPPPLDAPRSDTAASGERLPSFYLVQPIPESWTEDERESFLREYNHFMLEVLSIHEAIPGHYVQLYYGKRDPSKVRRAFSNGAFVEGWAVYTERVMVEAGYAGAPPPGKLRRPKGVDKRTWKGLKQIVQRDELRAKAIALHRLKFYLRTVTNAILDYEIHAGEMTEAEAMSLMVDRSFQQVGEAKAKWVRAQVTSTQLSTYFVGSLGWFRLRAAIEMRAAERGETIGPAQLGAFHAEALSHGAPPIHRLEALMGF